MKIRSATSAEVHRWFGLREWDLRNCSLPTVARFLEKECHERYMVTLTDRRKLSPLQLSREVQWAIHLTNVAFFGTHYKRRRTTFLATYAVQEKTLNDGLHVHLIVGVPIGSLGLKPNQPRDGVAEHLLQTWVKAAPTYRRRQAQDWRPAHHLAGALSYLQKTVWSSADIDAVDVLNTTFPTAYAVSRHAGE